jgi:hypothetical protein
MKKFLLAAVLLVPGLIANAQKPVPSEYPVYLGYGTVYDGWGDLNGNSYFVGVEKQLYKQHYASARITRNDILRAQYYDGSENFLVERSNSVSLDIDYNFQLNIWRFQAMPTLGFSIRYSDDQHVRSFQDERVDNEDYLRSVEYATHKGASLGASIGFNVNLKLNDFTSLGFRYYHQTFTNEVKYNMVAVQFKNAFWLFSEE